MSGDLFAIWSRLLRECVELYGSPGYDDEKDEEWNKRAIEGPFYCGMQPVMRIREFNIRLCGPTSTSHNYETANSFAGLCGIVMYLNNNGYVNSHRLRALDCSWISRYKEEEER